MLSIGEIAFVTGASRRMLRHWEEAGLIAPASVEESTGYRRYSRTQVGRVRAIAALRAVGFALSDIGDLLDHSHLTEARLLELLRGREQELTAQVSEASARLTEVRRRLSAIQEGRDTIISTLELGPLPSLRLTALRTRVGDESDIGEAVASLLPRLRAALASRGLADPGVVLAYDGTDDDAIGVIAGAAIPDGVADVDDGSGLRPVDVRGAEQAVTARFDVAPVDVGDAWTSLDATLEPYVLETTGVYRQVLLPGGGVVLQAPVIGRSHGR